MGTLTASAVSEIVIISNTDVEFVCNGRLYILEIGQKHLDNAMAPRCTYGESPVTGEGRYDYSSFITIADWQNDQHLTQEDFIEVITANQTYWNDVTLSTDKGLAMLRTQTRKNFLSWIVSSANKMRTVLKSASLAMHVAWTRARILASGVVNFVKIGDVDAEVIPVQTRRVAALESYLGTESTTRKESKKDILRFIDLDKFEGWMQAGMDRIEAAKSSIISMHIWQVVSW